MSYKDELTKANTKLAQNPQVRFIGYGLKKGRALGTLKKVADSQIIEMPVACLLYTSPSPRDRTRSRMPSSA